MNKKYILLLISAFSCIFSIAIAENYTDWFRNAYNYAYEKWVTTMNSISKANMYWSITRIEMAKMISEFSINVLWLKPDETKNCNFYDTDPDLDKQYNNWVTKACQLWLMWIYDDWEKSDYFNPKKTVTRWEWATILSRAIRLSEWKKVIKNWDPFYKPHINFILLKWIINSYDDPSPKSEEIRWNVMLMLYKTDPKNTIIVSNSTWVTNLKAWQIYRNDYFDIQITSDSKRPRLVSIEDSYDEDRKSTFYVVNIFNYVEENFDTLKLADYNIEEFQKTAKKYNQTWLLMQSDILCISEKWWFCDQQRDGEWLSEFWLFVYRNGKFIIRNIYWRYQEEPYYDTSYEDIYDSFWNWYVEEINRAINTLTRNKIYSYIDEFYIKWESISARYYVDKNEIKENENIIKEARKEIKNINNFITDISEWQSNSWNIVTSQKKKISINDTYYNSHDEYKMKHDWYFSWLIVDRNANKSIWFSVYVFVPESIWNFYLTDENKKNFSKNAEHFWQTGYLMKVRDYYFTKDSCIEDKWTTKKWYKICADPSSDYLIFYSRFPYENKGKNDVEKETTKKIFKDWVWYFPIDVNF